MSEEIPRETEIGARTSRFVKVTYKQRIIERPGGSFIKRQRNEESKIKFTENS